MRRILTGIAAVIVGFGVVALLQLARAKHEQDLRAGADLVNNLVDNPDTLNNPGLVDGHELVEREMGFRVTFPGVPQRERLSTGGWLYVYTPEQSGNTFLALAQGIDPARADVDVLVGAIHGLLAREPSTRILELMPCFEVPGARGVDLRLEGVKDGFTVRARVRLLVRPGRMFVLNTTVDDEGAGDRFLGSFALLPPGHAVAAGG